MKVFRSSFAGAVLATLALALPTAAQDDPTVDAINPNGGTLGTIVNITGTNFGDKKPKVFLTQKGSNKKTALKVTEFSATAITAEVKTAKAAGDYTLNVQPKGKGIPAHGGAPAGDQYVRLKVVLPTDVDDDLAALVGEWEAAHPYDPRRDLMREAAL